MATNQWQHRTFRKGGTAGGERRRHGDVGVDTGVGVEVTRALAVKHLSG